MPTIDESILINRPIGEVWAYLTDFFNTPRLSGSGIIGLRQTSAGPIGVGSTLQGRRVVLGFEARNDFEVTEWDPPNSFAMAVRGRPFRHQASRATLEARTDGTLLHLVVDFELRMPVKLLWPLMGPVIRRRMHAGFVRTKALIEAEG